MFMLSENEAVAVVLAVLCREVPFARESLTAEGYCAIMDTCERSRMLQLMDPEFLDWMRAEAGIG